MTKRQKKQISNIVRIGDKEKIEKYEHAILIRMNPRIYNQEKHKCIKIQVMASLLEFAEVIIRRWRFAGLNEVERRKKEITTDKGYKLPDAYEITLKKIPVLEMQEEEE